MGLPSNSAGACSGAVQTAGNGTVVGSRRCEVCGAVLQGAREATCSEKCRARRWRLLKETARQERDREVRALLVTALQRLGFQVKVEP